MGKGRLTVIAAALAVACAIARGIPADPAREQTAVGLRQGYLTGARVYQTDGPLDPQAAVQAYLEGQYESYLTMEPLDLSAVADAESRAVKNELLWLRLLIQRRRLLRNSHLCYVPVRALPYTIVWIDESELKDPRMEALGTPGEGEMDLHFIITGEAGAGISANAGGKCAAYGAPAPGQRWLEGDAARVSGRFAAVRRGCACCAVDQGRRWNACAGNSHVWRRIRRRGARRARRCMMGKQRRPMPPMDAAAQSRVLRYRRLDRKLCQFHLSMYPRRLWRRRQPAGRRGDDGRVVCRGGGRFARMGKCREVLGLCDARRRFWRDDCTNCGVSACRAIWCRCGPGSGRLQSQSACG